MTHKPQLADQLLAASIHEIKNRFGLMFSQLDQLLAALPLDDATTHNAEQIKSEAEFIGAELVRVLASYKTLEGDNIINSDQQFVVDFLEEKVARHANTVRAHGLALEFDCDEDLDGFFDAGVINIVLDTAIYNAVKEGAKTILLSAEIVEGFYLCIQIHDDGPGFPATMLEADPAQGAVKADGQSTGLGLYFARRLVSQHREGDKVGRLELGPSDRLSGACVSVFLPQ
ncbi:sensor histidine kinase [Ketobacter sp.]|uniref:sensor histidine kinase n=1 Tax=Ketobacter sp. TaxID=2083498 RepID=UPI000F1D43C5|nr:HAMP domain-containing sensor histidine kinase [Ketobacter sp.]RLT96013.1 MAG: sensor histidine kinase [Ketobacter sp.]